MYTLSQWSMAILSSWRHGGHFLFWKSRVLRLGLCQGHAPCFLGVTVCETWVRGPVVTRVLPPTRTEMRLMKDDGRGNLSLEEYHHPKIPRYAILSHTWEAEEVTFEDVMVCCGARAHHVIRCSRQVLKVVPCCPFSSSSLLSMCVDNIEDHLFFVFRRLSKAHSSARAMMI